MRWSQLKKRVEERFCERLQGRVQVWTTVYRHTHDREGRSWLSVDGLKSGAWRRWRRGQNNTGWRLWLSEETSERLGMTGEASAAIEALIGRNGGRRKQLARQPESLRSSTSPQHCGSPCNYRLKTRFAQRTPSFVLSRCLTVVSANADSSD